MECHLLILAQIVSLLSPALFVANHCTVGTQADMITQKKTFLFYHKSFPPNGFVSPPRCPDTRKLVHFISGLIFLPVLTGFVCGFVVTEKLNIYSSVNMKGTNIPIFYLTIICTMTRGIRGIH